MDVTTAVTNATVVAVSCVVSILIWTAPKAFDLRKWTALG
jgi:hypothetical protein